MFGIHFTVVPVYGERVSDIGTSVHCAVHFSLGGRTLLLTEDFTCLVLHIISALSCLVVLGSFLSTR